MKTTKKIALFSTVLLLSTTVSSTALAQANGLMGLKAETDIEIGVRGGATSTEKSESAKKKVCDTIN